MGDFGEGRTGGCQPVAPRSPRLPHLPQCHACAVGHQGGEGKGTNESMQSHIDIHLRNCCQRRRFICYTGIETKDAFREGQTSHSNSIHKLCWCAHSHPPAASRTGVLLSRSPQHPCTGRRHRLVSTCSSCGFFWQMRYHS